MPRMKKSNVVLACKIRPIDLFHPLKHEEEAIYAVNLRIRCLPRLRKLIFSGAIRGIIFLTMQI